MNLEAQIEAILFFKGEPISVKRLAGILKKSEAQIQDGLKMLEEKLTGRGLVLVRKEDEVMLGTAKEASEIIETVTKEELSRDIGKAGLETLSVVLYKGPVSRRDIDYIRGVNSQFILRNLMIRGLVERITNPKDHRSFLYKPTFDLLAHLGVKDIKELPEYEEFQEEISAGLKKIEEEERENSGDINDPVSINPSVDTAEHGPEIQ